MDRVEEQRRRILGQFDEQSQSLRRLVLFFLLPALLFGIFVFLPFTTQVSSAARLQVELDSAHSRLALTSDSLRRIDAVDSLVDALSLGPRLRRDLDFRFQAATELERTGEVDAETLRNWAAGTADADLSEVGERLWPGERAARGASRCAWLDDRRWRTCFDVTGGGMPCIGRGCLIQPGLVGPSPIQPSLVADRNLRIFPASGGEVPEGLLEPALAQELIDSLRAMSRALVEDLAPLSEVLGDSYADWGPGYETARMATEGFRNRVADRRREVRESVGALERDTTTLVAELERARRLIAVIEESGNSFTTPVGELPLGIRELVFLYPTLLGVAYFLVLAAFQRLVALRRTFHVLTFELGGEEATTGPLSVGLTAPLFYEPLRALGPQLGRVALALAPLAFMVWSYTALRSSIAGLATGDDSRLGPIWYDFFFWAAFVAAVVALFRAATVVREYARRHGGES